MRPMTRALIWLPILFAVAPAFAADKWFHLEVADHDGTHVELSLPASALEAVAAFLPEHVEADVHTDWGDDEITATELKRLWREVRRGPDMTFLTVREQDGGRLSMARDRGFLVVRFEERWGDSVEIRMPRRAVDAFFGGDSDAFDLGASLRAIAALGEGELLAVSGDERVRIWIDHRRSGH